MFMKGDICTECKDGWMIIRDGKLVCSHCGYTTLLSELAQALANTTGKHIAIEPAGISAAPEGRS